MRLIALVSGLPNSTSALLLLLEKSVTSSRNTVIRENGTATAEQAGRGASNPIRTVQQWVPGWDKGRPSAHASTSWPFSSSLPAF
ncbi:hypothetical protein BS78_03G391600 [Paspalum vaginatum]|nr:hypothetical protein BS78_03G391600 [Paspalum vaginatum]